MRRATALLLALVVLGGTVTGVALAARGDTELISRQSTTSGGEAGNKDSGLSAVSADGRYVAFVSLAENLSGADSADTADVFVRDTQTGTTELISRASASSGGQGGNGSSFTPSISANGRYVAFESDARNLTGVEDEGVFDVFVRDRQTGTTTLVSRQSGDAGGQGGDGDSFNSSISADGRYVAFESDAANLTGVENEGVFDVFVRDRQTGTTTLVSRRSGDAGGQGGDDGSFTPSISANGRYVAFRSDAANLTGVEDEEVDDVFLRDRQAETTTLVSRRSGGAGGQGGDGDSFLPSISANGRYVAFESRAENLSGADVAFNDVFVRDRQTGTTELVSRRSASSGGQGGDSFSNTASISADGRYVAFQSLADNLSGADGVSFDVFMRDRQSRTTSLVSRRSDSSGGQGANGESGGAAISGNGRYVAFDSDASNLSGADGDETFDIFRRDVLGP